MSRRESTFLNETRTLLPSAYPAPQGLPVAGRLSRRITSQRHLGETDSLGFLPFSVSRSQGVRVIPRLTSPGSFRPQPLIRLSPVFSSLSLAALFHAAYALGLFRSRVLPPLWLSPPFWTRHSASPLQGFPLRPGATAATPSLLPQAFKPPRRIVTSRREKQPQLLDSRLSECRSDRSWHCLP